MPNKYKQSKISLFQKYLLFIFRQNILDFDIHTCLLVLFAHVFYIYIYIYIYIIYIYTHPKNKSVIKLMIILGS